MKFKIGDKVRVREDLEVGECYNGCGFTVDMNNYKGEIATVKFINRKEKLYKLDLDEGYAWTEEMLEPYKELNKEHYAKEIADIATSKGNVKLAVNRKTLLPSKCVAISCKDCLFYNDCFVDRNKWANSEYVEPKQPVKLTWFEYEYLKRLKDNSMKYIVRDKDERIYCFEEKPIKDNFEWGCPDVELSFNECLYISFSDLFSFVKWEDKEPYLIDNILENCEVFKNVD